MRISLLVFSLVVLSGFFIPGKPISGKIQKLLLKHGCSSCHMPFNRLVGPSFQMIAKKNYSQEELANLIRNPNPDNWPGFPPMPGKTDISETEMSLITAFIASLK